MRSTPLSCGFGCAFTLLGASWLRAFLPLGVFFSASRFSLSFLASVSPLLPSWVLCKPCSNDQDKARHLIEWRSYAQILAYWKLTNSRACSESRYGSGPYLSVSLWHTTWWSLLSYSLENIEISIPWAGGGNRNLLGAWLRSVAVWFHQSRLLVQQFLVHTIHLFFLLLQLSDQPWSVVEKIVLRCTK